MSFYVWAKHYRLQNIELFARFPYTAQAPISGNYIDFKCKKDIWDEVENISLIAEKSKTRTIGRMLYDLVPLFSNPNHLIKEWMDDAYNEFYWIKNWNISAGNLDDISADRLDCWTIIENEIKEIEKKENYVKKSI